MNAYMVKIQLRRPELKMIEKIVRKMDAVYHSGMLAYCVEF